MVGWLIGWLVSCLVAYLLGWLAYSACLFANLASDGIALLGLRRLHLGRSLAKLAMLARTMLDLVGLLDLRDCAWLAHSRGSLRSHVPKLT